MTAPKPPSDFTLALGKRLRSAREQAGLSLDDVERQSAREFKAVVTGMYERGQRGISAERLAALAAFYRVPVTDLLPYPPLVAMAVEAVTTVKDIEIARVTADYERENDRLREAMHRCGCLEVAS